MFVFTYCSYRSSRYGYQYCCFSSDSCGLQQSILSSELPEKKKIPDDFIIWCERLNDWNLVLKHLPKKEEYILMLGRLEKTRDLERVLRMNAGYPPVSENNLSSDFYMTIGFQGKSEEIGELAVFLIKEYKRDGFRDLYNRLEKTIFKTEDATRYKIDADAFFSVLKNRSYLFLPGEKPFYNSNSLLPHLLIKIGSSLGKHSNIYLQKCSSDTKRQRKEKIDRCIDLLSHLSGVPSSFPLLIADEAFQINEVVHIRIDYEYLLGTYRMIDIKV